MPFMCCYYIIPSLLKRIFWNILVLLETEAFWTQRICEWSYQSEGPEYRQPFNVSQAKLHQAEANNNAIKDVPALLEVIVGIQSDNLKAHLCCEDACKHLTMGNKSSFKSIWIIKDDSQWQWFWFCQVYVKHNEYLPSFPQKGHYQILLSWGNAPWPWKGCWGLCKLWLLDPQMDPWPPCWQSLWFSATQDNNPRSGRCWQIYTSKEGIFVSTLQVLEYNKNIFMSFNGFRMQFVLFLWIYKCVWPDLP